MKLTIRDLFWLLAVAALLAGWYADHRRQAAQLRSEEHFNEWHYMQLAEVIKARTGAKTVVDGHGITIRYPDGSAEFYVRPPQSLNSGESSK